MAKKSGPVIEPTQGSLQVVILNLTGDDETMRQGLSALERTLSSFGSNTVVATRQVNGRKPVVALPAADPVDQGAQDDAEDVGDEGEGTEPPETPRPAKTGTPRQHKPPKFDSKLDPTGFKAFAKDRNPQTVDEKYLVACLWLQEQSGLAKYGASQIFTCFRAVSWPAYDDFTQPMRVMKRKKSYFDGETDRGEWKLNAHGLDEARKIKHPASA